MGKGYLLPSPSFPPFPSSPLPSPSHKVTNQKIEENPTDFIIAIKYIYIYCHYYNDSLSSLYVTSWGVQKVVIIFTFIFFFPLQFVKQIFHPKIKTYSNKGKKQWQHYNLNYLNVRVPHPNVGTWRSTKGP